MSDSKKSCLGFTALILGLGLAVVSLVAGGIGELVRFLGGDSLGINLKNGAIIAGIVFGLLFLTAVYFFISIRDWSWLPAIAGGVYAVLPDLVLGPEDDVLAMVAGVGISGLLSYFQYRRDKKGGPTA
ncbi:MAG: hypothetical protein JW757_09460 [Anaerolineales bacterium]|nr:hypothetical protein [Anaerolineales bacterium]